MAGRLVVAVLSAAALLLTPAFSAAPADAFAPQAVEFVIDVDGVPADGIVAFPAAAAPTQLVVFAHGHGHTTESWLAHVERTAAHGAIAVAMNYSRGFDVARSAAETRAATEHFKAQYPSVDETFLFGVSMGGAVSGIALAEAVGGTFDYWLNVEGVVNLFESWAEATAVGHPAAQELEAEIGGTPVDDPEGYAVRSPLFRVGDMHDVQGIAIIHPVNDGLVPYNQPVEFAAALTHFTDVPFHFYTVVRGDCSEQGTTGTSYTGAPNMACLAGHGSERSRTHVVMRTAFALLFDMMDGDRRPTDRATFTVDEPGP